MARDETILEIGHMRITLMVTACFEAPFLVHPLRQSIARVTGECDDLQGGGNGRVSRPAVELAVDYRGPTLQVARNSG